MVLTFQGLPPHWQRSSQQSAQLLKRFRGWATCPDMRTASELAAELAQWPCTFDEGARPVLSRARVKSCQEARHQVTRALNDALDLDFKIGFNASLFHASRGIESPANKKTRPVQSRRAPQRERPGHSCSPPGTMRGRTKTSRTGKESTAMCMYGIIWYSVVRCCVV